MSAAKTKKVVEIDHSSKREKLPRSKREAVKLTKIVTRLTNLATKLAALPTEFSGIRDNLTNAAQDLQNAAEKLGNLPATVRFGGQAKTPLAVGSKVAIRDHKVGNYTKIIDAADLKELKVERMEGSKVLVSTGKGVRLVLPRGYVKAA